MKNIAKMAGLVLFALMIGMAVYGADGSIYQITPGGYHNPDERMWNSEAGAGVININTASVDQIRMLPGFNDQLAANIVSYRNYNGPFQTLEDLLKVKGMTKEKLDRISQNLVLEGDTTYQPGAGE
jgi:competence protein ComEA